MSAYEYRTVALPRTVARQRRRGAEAEAVAEALGEAIAKEAAEGWEYQRAETLTTPPRRTLFGQHPGAAYVVLVFRRARGEAAVAPERRLALASDSGEAVKPSPSPYALGGAD